MHNNRMVFVQLLPLKQPLPQSSLALRQRPSLRIPLKQRPNLLQLCNNNNNCHKPSLLQLLAVMQRQHRQQELKVQQLLRRLRRSQLQFHLYRRLRQTKQQVIKPNAIINNSQQQQMSPEQRQQQIKVVARTQRLRRQQRHHHLCCQATATIAKAYHLLPPPAMPPLHPRSSHLQRKLLNLPLQRPLPLLPPLLLHYHRRLPHPQQHKYNRCLQIQHQQLRQKCKRWVVVLCFGCMDVQSNIDDNLWPLRPSSIIHMPLFKWACRTPHTIIVVDGGVFLMFSFLLFQSIKIS